MKHAYYGQAKLTVIGFLIRLNLVFRETAGGLTRGRRGVGQANAA
jgi:hypothetical protein